MPRKRVLLPQVSEAEETAIMLALIADEEGKKQGEIEPEPDLPPPEIVREPVYTSVDEYLRKQVNQELYHTDTPSEYERMLLTLREKL